MQPLNTTLINTSVSKISLLASAVLLASFLSGCTQTLAKEDDSAIDSQSKIAICTLPHSIRLSTAIGQAKTTLQQPGCRRGFDDVFKKLLIAGQSDPGSHQAIAFEEFIDWSEKHNVITMVKAKEIYSRYFGTKFISLKSDYSACSSVCKVKDKKLANMRSEYKNKELGLLKVLGDKQSFKKSEYLYNSMQSIINATCQSCSS